MKKTGLILIAAAALGAACHSSKKSTTTAAATPAATAPAAATTASAAASPAAKPSAYSPGYYAPGDVELAAIQPQYKEVTLEKLKEGYTIYTAGACIKCHNAKSIYRYAEGEWYSIMEDMAQRAHLMDAQKDAVYKYVLAIKAAKSKGN